MDKEKFTEFKIVKKDPPTLREIAWKFVVGFVALMISVVIIGYVGQSTWNSLTEITGLPEVSFSYAVDAVLLVWATGAAFRLAGSRDTE